MWITLTCTHKKNKHVLSTQLHLWSKRSRGLQVSGCCIYLFLLVKHQVTGVFVLCYQRLSLEKFSPG